MSTIRLCRVIPPLVLAVALALAAGCGGRQNLQNLSMRELYDHGMERYQKQKYLEAIDAFQAIVFNYPGATVVDTVQYYLALSYYGNEDYTLASVEFNRLLLNYPASVYASQAQLMKAVCLYEGTPEHHGLDQTDLETAIRQFEDYIVDYPESVALTDARAYLAKARARLAQKYYQAGIVYIRLSDYRAAKIYYQKVIDDFTDTEWGPKAAYQLAECHFLEHDWTGAQERFENFRIVYPDHAWASRAAARSCESAFKASQAAVKDGDLAKARDLLERAKSVCGQDSDKLRDIEDQLLRTGEGSVVEVEKDHAGT